MPIFREILCADRKILIVLYKPLHTKQLIYLTAQTERNPPIELDQLGLICRGPCTPSHRAAARSPVALPYAVMWSQTLQAQRPVGSLPTLHARQVSTAQHSTAQHSTAQPCPMHFLLLPCRVEAAMHPASYCKCLAQKDRGFHHNNLLMPLPAPSKTCNTHHFMTPSNSATALLSTYRMQTTLHNLCTKRAFCKRML